LIQINLANFDRRLERSAGPAAVSFLHTIESLVLPVLDLDPVLRPPGLIGPVAMLRDEALQPELASLAKQVRPDLALFEGAL